MNSSQVLHNHSTTHDNLLEKKKKIDTTLQDQLLDYTLLNAMTRLAILLCAQIASKASDL